MLPTRVLALVTVLCAASACTDSLQPTETFAVAITDIDVPSAVVQGGAAFISFRYNDGSAGCSPRVVTQTFLRDTMDISVRGRPIPPGVVCAAVANSLLHAVIVPGALRRELYIVRFRQPGGVDSIRTIVNIPEVAP